jgi:hypothetical protein
MMPLEAAFSAATFLPAALNLPSKACAPLRLPRALTRSGDGVPEEPPGVDGRSAAALALRSAMMADGVTAVHSEPTNSNRAAAQAHAQRPGGGAQLPCGRAPACHTVHPA